MSDTEYKGRNLIGLEPGEPAIGGLAPMTLCRWEPLGGLERAQDRIVAGAWGRTVADWSLSGATDWAQPNGTSDPNTHLANNIYPDAAVWRRLGTYRVNVTPGCQLEARVFYCPAGLTQKFTDDTDLNGTPDAYESAGAWAELRIGHAWQQTPGGATTPIAYRSMSMEGSLNGTWGGAENTGVAGQNWNDLKDDYIFDIRPAGYTTDPSVAAAYSEWSTVELRIEVRGGARVQQVVIYEVPLAHVQDHDNAGLKSVHAMPAGLAPQMPMPMIKPPNGATWDENRFGITQLMQVAERQSERLGPRLMHVSSWRESDASIWDQTEQNPFTTTSPTFVALDGSGLTQWSAESHGWIIAGAHAKLHRLCEPRLIARDGAFAVMPVRVRIDASQSAGTGTVRVQSGPFDWVDVPITGARAWSTLTGYLESQVYADHHWANVQVFVRCTSGTLSVYNVVVDYNAWPL